MSAKKANHGYHEREKEKTMDCEADRNQDLFQTAISGTVKQLKAALAKVDPLSLKDRCGNSLIHRAVLHGARPSIIKAIIDVMGQADVTNDNGQTPLALAAANGKTKITEILLAAGAQPNSEDDQSRTPLMEASNAGHADTVAMLIKHGADVNAADRHQETGLMMAAAWGYHKVVQTLVQAGASCDFPNKDRWTALTFAKDLGHAEVIKILEKHSKGSALRAA